MSDILTFVGGTLFGTLVSTWFNYYLKRPKLEIIGGGSGSASNHIDIRNAPGLFGIKLRETVILGWSVHPQIDWGFVVDRNPAHECRAFLYDKETNEMVKMLWWETYDQKLTQVITLHAGERAHLMLFARKGDQPLKYFVYEPMNATTRELRIPDEALRFDSTREFIIEIHHSFKVKRFYIKCKVTRQLNGRLYFNYPMGGGTF